MKIRSDLYLMEFLGMEEQVEDREQMAYRAFLQRARQPYPATYPTMRSWFGLNGLAVPGREQVYKIAFSLQLSLKELDGMLKKAIGEPGVQYHDYKEMIFAYGLQNHLAYGDALAMIDSFEGHFDSVVSLVRTHNTEQMMHQFEMNKGLSREEFLRWMVCNGSDFKGYSLTALDYLNKYKNIITEYIRSDARERLEALIQETDFDTWNARKRVKAAGTKYELVQKYIIYCRRRKKSSISEELINIVNELNHLSNPKNSFNIAVLSEAFDYGKLSSEIPALTEKQLSDLLNLPLQKEREIKAGMAENALKNLPGNAPCPSWIGDFIASCTSGGKKPAFAFQAERWIKRFRKNHRRRCHLIRRRDFLPMILYVAQRRYRDEINERGREYCQEDARSFFVNMANDTFAACGMEKINEQYSFDALLLSCFGPEDMYSLYELVESGSDPNHSHAREKEEI